jgi:hypothetical protein
MRFLLLLALSALLSACAGAAPGPSPTLTPDATAFAPSSAVRYPANYRTDFYQYVTVDRKDAVVRHIYVSPAAVDALRAGYPLPDDTIVVVEAFKAQVDASGQPLKDDQGHFVPGEPLDMLHVSQKRSTWQASDFPSAARAGKWNFGSFQYGSGVPFNEDLNACFNCHQATPGTDFLYSGRLLAQYAFNGQMLYSYCNLRRRIPCD